MNTFKAAIKLETPALTLVDVAGPVSDLSAWSISRRINAAGTWSARFPVADPMSLQVKTGWRATVQQEAGRAEDIPYVMPRNLLTRGKVTSHRYVIDQSGGAQLEIGGFTALGMLGEKLTHLGLTFTDASIQTIAAGIAPTATIFAPTWTPARTASLTVNDNTELAALLKLNDLFRTSLYEEFDSTDLRFVDQDNVFGSNYGTAPETLFTNFENFDPAMLTDAFMDEEGIGVLSGVPTIGYDGSQIVNKIRPLGTDYDGSPLTLAGATQYDPLYEVQTGVNPDGSNYYYLSDAESIAAYGEIETQTVLSSVKNPNNDFTSRSQAQSVLLAMSSLELLRRRAEIITFNCTIANSARCWILPGQGVHVKYRGVAKTLDGKFTFVDLDEQFLCIGRTDSGNAHGRRSTSFDLASYGITRTIPNLPNAIAIATPRPQDQKHSEPKDEKPEADDTAEAGDTPGSSYPSAGDFVTPPMDTLPDDLMNLPLGKGPFESCCADPTLDITHGGSPLLGGGGAPTSGFGNQRSSNSGGMPLFFAFAIGAGFDNTKAHVLLGITTLNVTSITSTSGQVWTFVGTHGTAKVWRTTLAAGYGLLTAITGSTVGTGSDESNFSMFEVNATGNPAIPLTADLTNYNLGSINVAYIDEAGKEQFFYGSGPSNEHFSLGV